MNISRILSLIVIIAGTVVMVGWIQDIDILKSILPIWVTMKFTTALCFLLSGYTLYVIAGSTSKHTVLAQIALPLTVLLILLIMGTLLASSFLEIRTGVEGLFIQEEGGAIMTSTPGKPSAGTMINFIVIALAGVFAMFKIKNLTGILKILGWIVTTLGTLAIVGYLFNKPLLYYTLEGWSSAMAFHTAILFCLLGLSLSLLKHERSTDS